MTDPKWLSEDEREMWEDIVGHDRQPSQEDGFVLLKRLAAERESGFHMSAELDRLRERNRELVEALNAITDYTYEAAIPGGDGKLQKLRAHAAAALAKNGGKP